jgi:hypothetical protein
MTDGGHGEAARRGESARAFGFTATLILTVLAGTLIAQLPEAWLPAALKAARHSAATVWPQAWAFFDAPADKQVLFVYRADPAGPGGYVLDNTTLMSAANRWGLSRSGQAQIIESYYLSGRIPAGSWVSCAAAAPAAACLADAAGRGAVTIGNDYQDPTLCGPVAFAVERPDGRRGGDAESVWIAVKAVRVQITCAP